ncbi:hypothetical protein E2562_034017 [Oryza meyeriana var. granulata]|uniref:Uncharacterized protein n=1 Tax=Oryza meyeriana var. granulata TaxID=110450 RepID=A0A6G1E6U5_9ORYZ|nr:hypothetical protein E2562_034017 [Oryza meyeriana var. granulata]
MESMAAIAGPHSGALVAKDADARASFCPALACRRSLAGWSNTLPSITIDSMGCSSTRLGARGEGTAGVNGVDLSCVTVKQREEEPGVLEEPGDVGTEEVGWTSIGREVAETHGCRK